VFRLILVKVMRAVSDVRDRVIKCGEKFDTDVEQILTPYK